jgi:hypothetical protein
LIFNQRAADSQLQKSPRSHLTLVQRHVRGEVLVRVALVDSV